MRLAHFSDIHVTVPPTHAIAELHHPKVILGVLNYYVGGRFLHFSGVEARIGVLLEDADAQSVDHVLCTGDITSMSHQIEFDRCASLFGPRIDRPERYTVLPGNHDRYTRASVDEERFERAFGRVFTGGAPVPFVKRIGERISLVVIDVSRPTLFASSGLLGKAQLSKTKEILTDRSLADEYVILALHYGLLRRSGLPDYPSHRLVDYRALIDVIDGGDVHLDLVLHGHIHRDYEVTTKRRRVICAGSATDLARPCGYNVYTIDQDRRTLEVERRTWDKRTGSYR